MFKGSIPALVTPFRNGRVDEAAFQRFVEWQIGQGSSGLVPCGTTGEAPTLTHDEHKRVIELCVEAAAGKVPVLAGTGSNSTAEAIELSQSAKESGADALLVCTPYYNKPPQEGMYRHFKAIHDAVDLPLVLYNIPGRCVVDMSLDTMARLAKLPNVVGVKDATADLMRPLRARAALGPDFIQLSGEDGTVVAFLAQGGVGCISVTANVAPKLCAELHAAWNARDLDTCFALRDKLGPLHDAMFVETNPGPVKYAVSLLGHCTTEMRLPMCEVADSTKERVQAAMRAVGVLD